MVELREEFVGRLVEHKPGPEVFCQASEHGKVDGPGHDCPVNVGPGDRVRVYYVRDPERDEDWVGLYHFCENAPAKMGFRNWPGEEMECALVEGTVEQFEGTIHGEFYEDGARLNDVEVLGYSPVGEGAD
ncbi:MAG: hypothetical protein ABEI98_08585 [Halorhabdus sp.]